MAAKKRIVFTKQLKNLEPDLQGNEKLSDLDFWTAMYAAYGICSRAVKIIKRDFKVDLTRQAVSQRSLRDPQKIKECRELMIDVAEETIMEISIVGNKKERLDASKQILKSLGKSRGWDEKQSIELSGEMTIKTVKVEHRATGTPFANSEAEIDAE